MELSKLKVRARRHETALTTRLDIIQKQFAGLKQFTDMAAGLKQSLGLNAIQSQYTDIFREQERITDMIGLNAIQSQYTGILREQGWITDMVKTQERITDMVKTQERITDMIGLNAIQSQYTGILREQGWITDMVKTQERITDMVKTQERITDMIGLNAIQSQYTGILREQGWITDMVKTQERITDMIGLNAIQSQYTGILREQGWITDMVKTQERITDMVKTQERITDMIGLNAIQSQYTGILREQGWITDMVKTQERITDMIGLNAIQSQYTGILREQGWITDMVKTQERITDMVKTQERITDMIGLNAIQSQYTDIFREQEGCQFLLEETSREIKIPQIFHVSPLPPKYSVEIHVLSFQCLADDKQETYNPTNSDERTISIPKSTITTVLFSLRLLHRCVNYCFVGKYIFPNALDHCLDNLNFPTISERFPSIVKTLLRWGAWLAAAEIISRHSQITNRFKTLYIISIILSEKTTADCIIYAANCSYAAEDSNPKVRYWLKFGRSTGYKIQTSITILKKLKKPSISTTHQEI